MKKRLVNWVFLLTSSIMVLSAFTDCTLLTRGTLKAAKADNKVKIISVDSVYLTDKKEVIVYSSQQFNNKKVKVEKAVFSYEKKESSSAHRNKNAIKYFSGAYLKNDVYKNPETGIVTDTFTIVSPYDSIFPGKNNLGDNSKLGEPLIVVKTKLPNNSIRLELTLDWGSTDKELVVYHLKAKSKVRRPQMYLVTPLAVAGDVVITGVFVGVAIVAVPVIIIQNAVGNNNRKKMIEEPTE